MTETAWYRLILGIRGEATADPEAVRERFIARAHERGLPEEYFGPDGWLYQDTTSLGLYRFAEVDEVQAALPHAPWLQLEPPCPHVGPVRLFLTWEWWEALPSADDREQLAEIQLGAANGYLARLDDDRCFDAIVERSFPQGEATAEHDLNDGAFLIDGGSPAYASYVQQTIASGDDPITLWGYNIEGLEQGELGPLLQIQTARPWLPQR